MNKILLFISVKFINRIIINNYFFSEKQLGKRNCKSLLLKLFIYKLSQIILQITRINKLYYMNKLTI